jgi:hypothetical protein
MNNLQTLISHLFILKFVCTQAPEACYRKFFTYKNMYKQIHQKQTALVFVHKELLYILAIVRSHHQRAPLLQDIHSAITQPVNSKWQDANTPFKQQCTIL